MRVLVVAHRMELGGTQVNVIDLAAEIHGIAGVDLIRAAAPGLVGGRAAQRSLTARISPPIKEKQ